MSEVIVTITPAHPGTVAITRGAITRGGASRVVTIPPPPAVRITRNDAP
jgi:hypothetical protein